VSGPAELLVELLAEGERELAEGRPGQAQLAFERAALRAVEAGEALRAGFAWGQAGAAALALGDRRGAGVLLRRALDMLDGLPGPTGEQAPAPEPGDFARPRLDPDRLAPYALALVLRSLGLLTSLEGDRSRAVQHLLRCKAVFLRLGAQRDVGDAQRMLGVTYTQLGTPDLAMAAYGAAEAAYRSAGDELLAAYARGQSSKIYHDRGQYEEAARVLAESIAALEALHLPAFWPRYQRSINLRKLGRTDEASHALRQSFEELLRASRQVAAPALRARWLSDKGAILDHTLYEATRAGDVAGFHGLLQRAKVTALGDHVALREAGLDALGDPERAQEVSAAYRDKRAALSALDRELVHLGDPVRLAERRALLDELDRLEGLLDLRAAALAGVRPLESATIQGLLPEGTVLVDYALLNTGLRAVVVTRDAVRLVDLPEAGQGFREAPRFVAEAAERTAALTREARAALARGEVDRARGLYTDLGLLDQLGQALLGAPDLRAVLAEARELVVVPHGPDLAAIPWALLRLDGRFLVEDLDVSSLPTIALLARTEPPPRPIDSSSRVLFLVAGHDELSARLALGELPLARFRNLQLLKGGLATRQRIAENAGGCDVLHFAGHAALEPDHPLWSHLAVGAGDRDPDWERLSVGDVLRLRLRPALAILSACSTGRAAGSAPDGSLGLAQAFMAANCRAVVSTQWAFEPDVSAALIPLLYDGLLAGAAPHQALCRAQRQLLADPGRLGCAWAWGAFQATFSG
jgi:tetratricopeptide (TPR) repeat protein